MKRLHVLLIVGAVALAMLAGVRTAQAQFRDLVSNLPNGSNAILIFNVEKVLASPMGVKQGWKENLEKAFEAGLIRVPPRAKRFVVASQIDFELMKPTWEAAVADTAQLPSFEKIAKEYMGTLEKIGDMQAMVLPSDAYVVALKPNTLGAMAPANRQVVMRWVRELDSPSKLSPYLQKAAGYAEDAGAEIIMAIDLEGAFAPERIAKYVKEHKSLEEAKVDRAAFSELAAGLLGVRVGVRIGESPFGKLTVDFRDEASLAPEDAKKAILTVLADGGMMIGDLIAWKPEVQGTTISLSGTLSSGGMRRIFSLVESPAPASRPGKEGQEKLSPGELEARRGQDTLRYFKTVETYFNDLKQDLRDSKTLSQTKLWYEKYARKIERLPILNVDKDMLDYGTLVARGLRAAQGSVVQMGISSAAREVQVQGTAAPTVNAAYYGGYGWGRGVTAGYYSGYGYANPGLNRYANSAYNQVREEGRQRRLIRSEERSNMAMDVQSIKGDLIEATNNIRRQMTEKYQIEF